MNFGKWIVVSFILFAGFIATLVTVCVREDVPLVTKEYYQEELVYQDQITRIENTQELNVIPDISLEKNNVIVTYASFPEIKKGELKLFRPSDSSLDQVFLIDSDKSTARRFEISNPVPGLYKARLKWEQGGKEYFMEKILVL